MRSRLPTKFPNIPLTVLTILAVLLWLRNYSDDYSLYSPLVDLPNTLFLFWEIYIIPVALFVAFKSIRRQPAKASLMLLGVCTLLVLFLGARNIEGRNAYITGDGGPSGPHFACLAWSKEANIAYDSFLGTVQCVYYYTPEFNKFWIDQSRDADSGDTLSSYLSLALHFSVLFMLFKLSDQKLIRSKKQNIT